MNKYHINPKTGKPGICRAKTQCRFGEASDHYDTPAAAQEGYEEMMKANTLVSRKSAKPQSTETTSLSKLMDPALLNRMIDEGFIMVQTHPDDDSLKVMSYSKTAQTSGKWNDATKQARGLIIKSEKEDLSDAVVIERPWRKFFTLSQIKTEDGKPGWALGDEEEGASNSASPTEFDKLDFHAPAEVTDKMDGSLGILYQAPDGKLALATKGSFASDQAVAYTKMLRENATMYSAAEKLKKDHPDTTYLFELVGRDNQIVLSYDKDDITFLGAVNKDTGVYHSTSDYEDTWSEEKGLSRAEVMHAKNLEEALAMPDRMNKEGVVVRFKTTDPARQMQVKIKQDDYVRLHRLLSTVSKKGTRSTLRETSGTMGDVLKFANNEEIRTFPKIAETMEFFEKGGTPLHARLLVEQEKSFKEAMLPKAKRIAYAYEKVENLPASAFSGDNNTVMKNFAQSVSPEESDVKGYLFDFFRKRLRGEDPRTLDAERVFAAMARDF